MDLYKLAEPFPEADIEWRVGQDGKQKNGDVWCRVLAYVTNRAIMDRLDAVCGPDHWRNEFQPHPPYQQGMLCGLSILTEVGWVTKWDGSEPTEIEPVKGGLSSAMKRAAVQWGIGRYLYNLGESWGNVSSNRSPGAHYVKAHGDVPAYFWTPPRLAAEFLPTTSGSQPAGKPQPVVVTPQDSFNAWIRPLISTGVISRPNVESVLAQNKNDYDAARAEIEGNLELLKK